MNGCKFWNDQDCKNNNVPEITNLLRCWPMLELQVDYFNFLAVSVVFKSFGAILMSVYIDKF